jgi:hypothetical protein
VLERRGTDIKLDDLMQMDREVDLLMSYLESQHGRRIEKEESITLR